MTSSPDIPVQNWALPGEPFRLAAVSIQAADWLACIPPARRATILAFTNPNARWQAGASEWLKHIWLPGQLGVGEVEWTTGPNGKPTLSGDAAEWGFNLSHAGDFAVAVLAHGCAIGVDIESAQRKADVERLAERVFSAHEQELVRCKGPDAFFALWSQKEALMKALGCGWADGAIQRKTRLDLVPIQTEPSTGARIWSRTILDQRYHLAIAILPPQNKTQT